MAVKIDPAATWRELGMKTGIKVPGTTSWMIRWRKEPNQYWMIEYAQKVELLFKTMSNQKTNQFIQLYLSGKWDPEDEIHIAAAIRRTPIIEGKYNLMEVERMRKKKDKTAVKEAEAEDQGLSLKERIGALEEQVKELTLEVVALQTAAPAGKKKGKKAEVETDSPPATADVKELLEELAEAKEEGDKKKAFGIRVKLRKKGYSLRANGKK